MDVRRLREGEGARLRELRLRALADSPEAFCSSLADERAEPDSYWENLALLSESSERQVTFVAQRDADEWVGMAGGHLVRDEHYRALLVAMWVAPDLRGFGLGRRLADDVAEWAVAHGATTLQVSVMQDNVEALAIYGVCGFEATGQRTPLATDPERHELEMTRPLARP